VTRAVRVVDLITNLDMQSFQSQGGMLAFINRLQVCMFVGDEGGGHGIVHF